MALNTRGSEPVHGVAADAQHRARLVGAEYRVGRCDELHLAPASALGHGRPRAPLVSRPPRVPGRGRLSGRSPPSFPAASRIDGGVHGRPRNQKLPAEPVRVDLSRPDEAVCLAPARPMYSCISITVIHSPRSWLPSGVAHSAVRAMVPPIFPCGTARGHRTTPCAFSSARRLNRLMAISAHGGNGEGSSWVELVGSSRNGHEPRGLAGS